MTTRVFTLVFMPTVVPPMLIQYILQLALEVLPFKKKRRKPASLKLKLLLPLNPLQA
jgi:hypothetical protein